MRHTHYRPFDFSILKFADLSDQRDFMTLMTDLMTMTD
jgi:hypothetical protein